MPVVYLSLGSNLGQRKRYINKAIVFLNKNPCFQIERISSFYETEPEGFKNQPKFINICLKARTGLSPEELFKFLKEIEKKLGRKERKQWGPREIDIDILFYGKRVIRRKGLIIPHPRLGKRVFVLKPLVEISPHLRHPVSGVTMSELLKHYKDG